ncbi:hypothetical protein COU53_01160 [Candidatus Pacearchaeota archaeon CG10_big_fil_rev_8_21_14_0_10_30_48]|nr:MAG: hypothetical protein COU53_01160 [Candidatus Pacearchaeota archaeon CG10_big_fil_rev_8_21_14_0_10_30_48]
MSLQKNIEENWEIVKSVLSNKKYLLIMLGVGIVMFGILYYFMVAKIADNSLRIAIMMSGSWYITKTFISIMIISTMFGTYTSLLFFKITNSIAIGGKSFFGILGALIGGFGVGCPTCGALLFGLIGAPLALMSFPLRGFELQLGSILLLGISIYFIAKSINAKCDLR